MAEALLAGPHEAIYRAQLARLNLVGLLVVYGIPPEQLPLLLDLPAPIKRALADWGEHLLTVARLLAEEHGVDDWAAFPTGGKVEFQAIAFELIESLPLPFVPHASVTR